MSADIPRQLRLKFDVVNASWPPPNVQAGPRVTPDVGLVMPWRTLQAPA